jgi:hypothetical protein
MMANTHWKTDIADLRARAQAVMTSSSETATSARAAAQVLSGIVGLVVRRFGIDVMQRTCADLVRHDAAWRTKLGSLPAGMDGRISEATQLIAVVGRGLFPLAGADNVRAAMSFWASEDDPAVWNQVAA